MTGRPAGGGLTIIRKAGPGDRDALVDLWLRSVAGTHTFLTKEDVASLLPLVRDQVLDLLELWVLCDQGGALVGFLGMAENSVEALFIAPDRLRRGHGRALLEHARSLGRGRLRVDVNEQNPMAVRFYEACGFRVTGRSPVDAGGRPFPLLHLEEPVG